jgi:cyanophycin synthetase
MEGKAKFMIENVLAASLAAIFMDLELKIFRILYEHLFQVLSLLRKIECFKFKNFKVLIDFAHNPAGYEAIEDYLKNVEATKKIELFPEWETDGIMISKNENCRKNVRSYYHPK